MTAIFVILTVILIWVAYVLGYAQGAAFATKEGLQAMDKLAAILRPDIHL